MEETVEETNDRREFRRMALRLPVKFATVGDMEGKGTVSNVSKGGLLIETDAIPDVGDDVIAYPDGLGRISGKVVRRTDNGFAMAIDDAETNRAHLERRIEAAAIGLPYFHLAERRRRKRFPLRIEARAKTIPAGREFACAIIDISRAGAFVESDNVPSLGSEIKIGVIRGRVSRLTENGFAIKFERTYTQAANKHANSNVPRASRSHSSTS
jgi:hypothetical protein